MYALLYLKKSWSKGNNLVQKHYRCEITKKKGADFMLYLQDTLLVTSIRVKNAVGKFI